MVGQVKEMIQSTQTDKQSYITLEQFHIAKEEHHIFNMPILKRCDDEEVLVLIAAKVLFLYSYSVKTRIFVFS